VEVGPLDRSCLSPNHPATKKLAGLGASIRIEPRSNDNDWGIRVSYILRRLVRALLLLVGVSALCFLFSEMAPGSFFDEMRLNPQISPETILALRSRYGLDQPLVVRYGRWMRSALHADLGYSIAYNLPVAPLLWSRAKNTLLLTSTALVLTWLISVPLGVWTANRRGGMLDKAVGLVSALLSLCSRTRDCRGLLAIAVRWRILPSVE
jgi:ABC-type dipeptide/oligopeptide/nickel transport system permease component